MVEHGASHLREPRQVTRVNADGLEFMPVALELASDNDGIAHTLLDIVGVYEERAVIGISAAYALKADSSSETT